MVAQINKLLIDEEQNTRWNVLLMNIGRCAENYEAGAIRVGFCLMPSTTNWGETEVVVSGIFWIVFSTEIYPHRNGTKIGYFPPVYEGFVLMIDLIRNEYH